MNEHICIVFVRISLHEGWGIYFLPCIVDPGHLNQSTLHCVPAFKSTKAQSLIKFNGGVYLCVSRKYGMYTHTVCMHGWLLGGL